MTMRPTAPRGSKRMCGDASRFVDERDEVPLLDRLLGFDVEFADDTWHLRDHGYFHLHRLEDHDLVAFRDHLTLLGDDLPDVCGDLGPNLVHLVGSLRPAL